MATENSPGHKSTNMSDDDAAAGAVVNFISQPSRRLHDLRQYAENVVDFSSQYGSDYSISYTARNITGRPNKYPEYGDFPETFAMRTYGNWWQHAPSRWREIQPQNLPKTPAQDFIVISFEEYIMPNEIAVFETFNPGAIVRLWAFTVAKVWTCLWECTDFETRRPPIAQRPRRFAPPLKELQVPTKCLRIEFNHSRVDYFTQIDGVMLSGKVMQHNLDDSASQGSIVNLLRTIQFRPDFRNNYKNTLHDFFVNDLNKFIEVLSSGMPADEVPAQAASNDQTCLKDLPFEIMLKIFGYLDLMSLFRVAEVCRFFYDVATHPLLYTELNLKPYWHSVSTDLLCTLAKRSTILRKLDLSWCGLYNSISSTEFKKFIQQCGDMLTHLRLDSSRFLNPSCIQIVGIVCDNLKELSLRNCSTDLPLLNFSCLANLKNLERLDLFQTVVETELLLTMLESNRKLKHLNLAYCGVAVNMDLVAQHIGYFNEHLISLDLWKSHLLSASGLLALAHCHDLEELDVGWCLREASLGDSLKRLINNCPKLRKLFLATVRGVTDGDVTHIANYCPNLEQLDLMGVFAITKERYHEILTKCQRLQLLDLSFCDNISETEVSAWSRKFNVEIKYSQFPVVA